MCGGGVSFTSLPLSLHFPRARYPQFFYGREIFTEILFKATILPLALALHFHLPPNNSTLTFTVSTPCLWSFFLLMGEKFIFFLPEICVQKSQYGGSRIWTCESIISAVQFGHFAEDFCQKGFKREGAEQFGVNFANLQTMRTTIVLLSLLCFCCFLHVRASSFYSIPIVLNAHLLDSAGSSGSYYYTLEEGEFVDVNNDDLIDIHYFCHCFFV